MLVRLLPILLLPLIAIPTLGQVYYQNLNYDPVIQALSGNKKATGNQKTTSTTLSLPFLEEFSTYTGSADTTKFISGGGTYVNGRFPVCPPTLNAATFDGIDESGQAYEFSDEEFLDGATDELVSCEIDLSSYAPASDVVISFYWQKGSILELNAPDENDSLRLQFKDNTDTWSTVWVEYGDTTITDTSTNDFTYVAISLDSNKYFHNGFQFRFQSYGRMTGPFDVWSVDYIYMDAGRSSMNPISESGFSTHPTSILKDYQAMPFTHFLLAKDSALATSVCAKVFNQAAGPVLLNDTLMTLDEVVRGINIETTLADGGDTLLPSGGSVDVCWTPSIDSINTHFTSLNDGDSIELKYRLNISTGDVLSRNDSSTSITILDDYYAYDDGSVESGAGIAKNQGRIMVEFETPIDDNLTGMEIYFPRHSPDISGTAIKLWVMDALEGVDGAPSDHALYQPTYPLYYGTALNQFHRYEFPISINVPAGKFYIGYQQFTNNNIYVGLDANTDQLDKVKINVNGSWQDFLQPNDSTKGSLMIRPVFGNNVMVGVEDKYEPLNVDIFPNPASESFRVSAPVDNVIIYSNSGVEINNWTGKADSSSIFDISSYPPGIYVIHLIQGNKLATKKLCVY